MFIMLKRNNKWNRIKNVKQNTKYVNIFMQRNVNDLFKIF